MSTTLRPEGDTAPVRTSRPGSLVSFVLALLVAGAAVAAGAGAGVVTLKSALLIPLGAVAAVVLTMLACTRFEAFVIAILLVRTSLDALKLGPGSSVGLDPAAAVAVLFMAAGALWLVARRRLAPPAPASPLRWPMAFFLLAGLVSAMSSPRLGASLLEAARIAAVVMMVLVLEALLVKRSYARPLLIAVFGSAVIPLAVAAYQVSSGTRIFQAGGFSRITGTFLHPNPFAIYLTLVLVMGMALVPHVRGWARVGLVALIGPCVVFLILTYTRTAWIAALVGLLVVGALQSRKLIVGLLVGAAVILVAVPSVLGRFADVGEERHLSGTPGNSLVWRFEYWGTALSLVEGHTITGIGLKMTQFETEEAKAPHNDFIRTYVETGLLGLGAYLALLVALVRTARRSVATALPGLDRGLAVGFAGCVTAFLLISVVSNVISQVVLLWYVAAFAVLTASVQRRVPRMAATDATGTLDPRVDEDFGSAGRTLSLGGWPGER